MRKLYSNRVTQLFVVLLVVVVGAHANPLSIYSPQAVDADFDFSELDKLVPAELKERNTPGAVITVVMGDRVVYQ